MEASEIDVTTSESTVVALAGDETFVFDRIDGESSEVKYCGAGDPPMSVLAAVSDKGFRVQQTEVEWPIELTTYGRVMDQDSISEKLYSQTRIPGDAIPDRFTNIPEFEVTFTVDSDGSVSVTDIDW